MPSVKEADVIELFNQYHDRRGRFSTKQGATSISGDVYKFKKGEFVETAVGDVYAGSGHKLMSEKEFRAAAKEYANLTTKMNKAVTGLPKKSDMVISDKTLKMGAYGYFEPKTGNITMHPLVARDLAKGNVAGRMIYIHEKLHTRGGTDRMPERARGNVIDIMTREEGLNSLMTEMTYRKVYGKPHQNYSQSAYQGYMETVAGHFWEASGHNSKKAWAMIDAAHRTGISYETSYRDMTRSTSGVEKKRAFEELMRELA